MATENLLHSIPVGPHPPKEVYCVVEIPKGCSNKYEYKISEAAFFLDRVLYEAVFYPTEYGFIPQTWSKSNGGDRDPIDIMVVSTHPTFSGCIVPVRPIGVFHMLDSGRIDDKIIGVPSQDPRFHHVRRMARLGPHFKKEIKNFWETYARLQPEKKIKFKGWGEREKAYNMIEEAMEEYKRKFEVE